MNGTVVFRLDGGHALGLGHVKRCLTLADEITRRGSSCVLVFRRANDAVIDLVRAAGHRAERLPENSGFDSEAEKIAALVPAAVDAIVLDFSHRETLREADSLPSYFEALRTRFPVIAVIDGPRHECLVGRFELPVDLAVIPYAGADEQEIRTRGARLALGPAYFVLDGSYAAGLDRRREIADAARRVLVTAGGSDPKGFSAMALSALERIDDRILEVRLVIGPAYDTTATAEIAPAAARGRHRVTLVERPGSLASHMSWCDLAVSLSGFTKYELAATGTPAILVSIDADHAASHGPFERLGTARHLGVVERVSPAELARAICALLDDGAARRAMSAAGRDVLDGRGAARLADALMALMKAAPAVA